MKNIGANTLALLGLAVLGTIMLILGFTSLVQEGDILPFCGWTLIIMAGLRIFDLSGQEARTGRRD